MDDSKALRVGCGFFSAVLLVDAAIGALCFQVCLWSLFGKDAPWYLDLIGGTFLAPVVVPLAVLCGILRACGVVPPFFHAG